MTAAAVRRIRQQLGMTQAEFAERLGVHTMTVSRWERGTVAVPEPVARLIHFVRDSARGGQR
jgi:DNA-binding transcriptional regulator YiaG